MTNITRERIEQYANDPRMCNVNDEIREMARRLLAAESKLAEYENAALEPVAWGLFNVSDDALYHHCASMQAAEQYRNLVHQSCDTTTLKIKPLYTTPQSAPAKSAFPCPYPCGWDELNKLAMQDAGFLAVSLNEGEVITQNHRLAAIANNGRLIDLIAACRTSPQTAPVVPSLSTGMAKGVRLFTKKPVTISAIQWTGDNLPDVIAFTGKHPRFGDWFKDMDEYVAHVHGDGGKFKIFTLEGVMDAVPGDWIIRGVQGEHYPCKPDIFAATYEAVELQERRKADSAEPEGESRE